MCRLKSNVIRFDKLEDVKEQCRVVIKIEIFSLEVEKARKWLQLIKCKSFETKLIDGRVVSSYDEL